ncbi:phosphonate ABC transporter substrate-binding protein [Rhizobium sp. RM]|uniref:phosphonate ABC transporter substrate-binding protein n=1 Tax=Rhizobium sp. RM TaxID=2748079 RepID=UPI00110E57CE|nr:phosphonate ABC transporter substrate-binding protein [Rhizobium sp. RM]NWJ25515.1 phosphonate ABC transporter substrate-binding protein [Rhizobium sp. RM]TMV22169.1 phosphonate ABC transporter substrate-binding protein [Rhizobium sp. Td3]
MNAILKSMAAMSLALTLGSAAHAAETINFGIISTESQQNLKSSWLPFLDAMKEKTGLEVKPFFASDYAGIIEGMRFDKVQMAWYGNKSAMEAVDRADGEVFVQSVAVTGEPGYWSVVIVPKESPIQTIDQLLTCDKSLNFGLGDVNSTSGYLVPMTFVFSKNSIDPKTCFKNVTNANHETNAMAVANKQVDAAANNTENMALIEQNNPKAFANIREIWRSPLIPADPIVWRKDLPEEAKTKIRDFFLTYGTDKSKGNVEEEKKILAGLKWSPFRASNDNQLLPIRVMELTKAIAQAQGDAKLDAAARDAKIKDLTAQKARYEAELASLGN